ncbi:MAG: spermidine/putrescine ABC transporter substrate-binding protein [Gammaproteobacteria bacterium]|nr:spermidine/putrescine ABC transporter substrate-binding protein [Gammaproteobacteria bacterium]MDH5734747.1 spermidine/putrescine ABC transporter substrate-binding protein [Gammaproteobacteria bacterium]
MKKLLASVVLMAATPLAIAGGQLHLFNWNDYIAEETVTAFEKSCDCQLVQDYYSSTEEMMAKLLAGASGYDVVVPTQNAVQALIKQDFLQALDKAQLSNLKNSDPGFLKRSYDPQNTYSVPYAFTTTLVGYNEKRLSELGINPGNWSIIFDPAVLEKIRGKVTVMDDAEELFAAALKYLGYSINDQDEKHLREAQKVIMKAKPYWAAFNSSSYIKELTVGNIWVAHGYSSDMVQARADAEAAARDFTINFVLPEQGAVLALDNMVIPKDSKNKTLAHQFINFMLDGKNAAALTNEIGAGNPNKAAAEFIDAEIKKQTAIFPDAATLARLETIEATSAKQRRLLNKLWTEIKIK